MGMFKIYSLGDTVYGANIIPAGTVINNANAVFVNSMSGSDVNAGTRSAPFATIAKASSIGNKIIVVLGNFIENVSTINYNNLMIIADSECASLLGSLSLGSYQSCPIFGLKTKSVVADAGCVVSKCFINGTLSGVAGYNPFDVRYNFIDTLSITRFGSDSAYNFNKNTILRFNNYAASNVNRLVLNSIITTSVDIYNFTSRSNIYNYPVFKNVLFRKATVWKWNGVEVPINYGTYGNAEGDYLADVISAMHAYTPNIAEGEDRNYFSSMFPNAISSPIFYIDANGQTCKVVEDRPSVPGSKKIFNRYVGDNPVDYSLFLHADNVALIMSDELSYVGCYKANADVLTFGDVMNVNEDGSDDLVTPPDMLIYDGSGKFRVSIIDSVQIRNRVRSSVFHFKRGFTLDGFQSQMKRGLVSRFSIGKFQPYNITDAPTLPQESIEVIPYDDAVTPSAFPRFSAMFNDKVQMWYHTAGAKKDLPVLFNDLLSDFAIVTDKSLDEYGAWAVTNADYETFELSTKANVKLQNVPVYFAQVEINLNYHV